MNICVLLPEKLKASLDQAASSIGISPIAFIRRAVTEKLVRSGFLPRRRRRNRTAAGS